MSKIGDLFIKLGLKKDDFNKGIDEAEKQVKGFSVSTKAMATAAAAAWAAVAAAVVKFAKDAVKMTQTWGDQWNVTMAGVKGAYSAFVRQLSSGEGFDNLFANMREAARVSREVAKALDEVFERTISGNYRTAEIDNTIADLQKIQRDATKSREEKNAAIAEEKKLTQEKYDLLKDIQRQEANGYRTTFQLQTGLNDEQTDFLVKEYNANQQLIQQARKYREERQKAFNEGGGAPFGTVHFDWAAARAEQAKIDAQYSDTIKAIADWTRLYDKGNDELVANMAKAEVAIINLDTQAKHATDRADRLAGRLAASDNDGGKTIVTQQVEESISSLELLEQALERADRKRKALLESHRDIVPIDVDVFGLDADMAAIDEQLDAATESIQQHYEELNRQREQWADLMEGFRDAIVDGFADACEELMNQLMGLKDFNPGAVVQALLTPLADMAEKAGAIIMAEGLATLEARKALETFGATGWGAVAAGAALIAAGAAAKAGLAALAKSGSTNASAAGYSGSGSGGTATQNLETEMTIYVEGRISGSDIVLAGQKTLNDWSR